MGDNNSSRKLDKANPQTSTKKGTTIGAFESVQDFTKNGLEQVVKATKASNRLPQSSQRDFYKTYPVFEELVERESSSILDIMTKVLKTQYVRGNFKSAAEVEKFGMLSEFNDIIMERLNLNLDKMEGVNKNPEIVIVDPSLSAAAAAGNASALQSSAGSWNLKRKNLGTRAGRIIMPQNIERPQLTFTNLVDNSSAAPFVPRLKYKPNSLKPLAILPEYDLAGNIVSYVHPYEFELLKFTVPEKQLQRMTPQKPEHDDYLYVETVPQLQQALKELQEHSVLSVDVEHHSYRSFQGITCLLQISTRSKDYIFDALKLRDELHVLNEVFTNKNIVKIFHGANMDIEWLQRDLSLYVVNMFDTHQAAKMLNLSRLSLAHLLKHYCNIEVDKSLQLADWRIRPLPENMEKYARQDTHYLIYVFERLTNDLLTAANEATNMLKSVYTSSNEICLKRYVKPVIDADSHMEMYRKSRLLFDNRQMFALATLYQWRDEMARTEDESIGYVMPNHMLLQVANILPRETQGIIACCNPVPQLVRQHLYGLHDIVLRARAQPLIKPVLAITNAMNRIIISNAHDYNNKLYCPHDLSHIDEERDDLPTLFNLKADLQNCIQRTETMPTEETVKLAKPVINMFEQAQAAKNTTAVQKSSEQLEFITPYQRYVAVLPLMELEKQAELKRRAAEDRNRRLCPDAPTPHIKSEPEEEEEEQEAIDNLPIQEQLKRKHADALAAKKQANLTASPAAKRLKPNTVEDSSSATLKRKHEPTKSEVEQKHAKTDKSPKNTTQNGAAAETDDDSDSEPEELPSTSASNSTAAHQQQSNRRNKKKNRKTKFSAKSFQSSQKPVQDNFNYKNVDFKKFQGGAQRAQGAPIKAQFHAKSHANKAQNKKLNKLFTFSNTKSNKK